MVANGTTNPLNTNYGLSVEQLKKLRFIGLNPAKGNVNGLRPAGISRELNTSSAEIIRQLHSAR